MKLLTCTGCKLAGDCGHATFLRSSLKGYGIRTLKFACALREDIFRPGQAALFTTFVTNEWDGDYGGHSERLEVSFPGHVIKQMGSKVFGFIKPGVEDSSGEGISFEAKVRGYVKIPLTRVKPDDSRETANVTACRWCGQHAGLGDVCGKDPHYTPHGMCLADQFAGKLADAPNNTSETSP